MESQGVCLIAVGKPCFGIYAYNFAVSLKFADPAVRIALFHEPKTLRYLSDTDCQVFDHLIPLTPEHRCWHLGQINPIGFKLRLFLFTPFQKTIYIDADSLWTSPRPVSSYFDQEMREIDWACLYKGRSLTLDENAQDWLIDHGTADRLFQLFAIPAQRRMHECHTQWLYSSGSARAVSFFRSASDLYEYCQSCMDFGGSRYRGRMVSDELILSVSTALFNESPGRVPFIPTTDGSDPALTSDQVIVNIVGLDTTPKARAALQLYQGRAETICASPFAWRPKPWIPKECPYA
jgi:hypothetical protein